MPEPQCSARALNALRKRLRKLSAEAALLAISIKKNGEISRPKISRKRATEIILFHLDYTERDVLDEAPPQ